MPVAAAVDGLVSCLRRQGGLPRGRGRPGDRGVLGGHPDKVLVDNLTAGFIAPLAPLCRLDHALLAPTRVVWG